MKNQKPVFFPHLTRRGFLRAAAPICDAEIGHRSVTVCHLGVLSMRLGRKLHWDPASETFGDDKEANSFLAREMRKPWNYDSV